MKHYRWLVLAVVLAVFGLLMLTATFHVARAKTATSNGLTLTSSHNPNATHVVDLNRVYLHVEDRVGIGSTLASALRRELEKAGFDVILLNNDPGPDDIPLLLAGIRDNRSFWTPFYASATLRVVADYASYTTDFQLDDRAPLKLHVSEVQSSMPLRMRMNVDLTNSVIGLVTLPAHRHMLVAEPATAVVEYVKKGVDEMRDGTGQDGSNE